MAGKYLPLQRRLEEILRRGDMTVEFSFHEIEVLVGSLPASARAYRPWWANNSQSQALAWRDAGWHVDTVSFDRERVRFARGARGGSYAVRGRTAPKPDVTSTEVENSRPEHDRVVLVGCVESKADVPMRARDLYTSALFGRRREYAERTGAPWFIVSSQWGLVDPGQILAPYDMYLADQPRSYRRAWGRFVVEQLALATPLSESTVVEIHAGQDYIDAIAEPLAARHVQVSTPVRVSSQGEMLQWYSNHSTLTATDVPALVVDALAQLSLADHAVAKPELVAISPTLAKPGLYSWWVDASGADDLSRGLGYPVSPGLIYAGQAGATREPSGKTSDATLASRLLSQHFNGSTRGSTFRLTIASVLESTFGTRPTRLDLSGWMASISRSRLGPLTIPRRSAPSSAASS
jgi:hypothetical protein